MKLNTPKTTLQGKMNSNNPIMYKYVHVLSDNEAGKAHELFEEKCEKDTRLAKGMIAAERQVQNVRVFKEITTSAALLIYRLFWLLKHGDNNMTSIRGNENQTWPWNGGPTSITASTEGKKTLEREQWTLLTPK